MKLPASLAAPSLPLAVALAIAPVAGVLQSKAIAPIATIALLLCVVAHRRRHGAWPWPQGAAAWVALALFGWARGHRALGAGAAAGARHRAADRRLRGARRRRRPGRWRPRMRRRSVGCCWPRPAGWSPGWPLAALDAMTGHAIRAAVRGLKEVPVTLAFGLKPAASAMGLWLPLVAAAGLARWLRGADPGGGRGGAGAAAGRGGEAGGGGRGAWPAGRRCWRRAGRRGCWARAWPWRSWPCRRCWGRCWRAACRRTASPPSAAHRLLIWDFVTDRIAERPIARLGDGGEPGDPRATCDPPSAEPRCERFHLTGPGAALWLPAAQAAAAASA